MNEPPVSATAAASTEDAESWLEIVGVVPSVWMSDSANPDGDPGFYEPRAPADIYPIQLAIHLRGDPMAFVPRLREIVGGVDPTLRLSGIMPLEDVRDFSTLTYTLGSRLLLGTSGIALLLSLAGIYAAMSLAVSRRRREIGIRVALGAKSGRILMTIFRGSILQVGLGLAAGTALLILVAIGVDYNDGIPPFSPVYLVYIVAMIGVCMLACAVPTRRALAIEPTEAMRADV